MVDVKREGVGSSARMRGVPPASAPGRPAAVSRRRGQTKGDRNEQAILDTCERLLAEKSLMAITIDEMAGGAGISRPTFYFYFPSREAVLATLAERLHEQIFEASQAWLRRKDESPAAALRRTVEAILALWREHGPVLRATVQARTTDPDLRDFWAEASRRFVVGTAEHIQRERDAGIAPPGPPDATALASVLASMNEQVCYNTSLRRRSAQVDREVADTLVHVWLHAVYGTIDDAGSDKGSDE
jgi:AcrR family transcriptional regulator